MHHSRFVPIACVSIVLSALLITYSSLAVGQAVQPESDNDERWIWDLTVLYADDATWDQERIALMDRMSELSALQGTLGNSAEALADALDTLSEVGQDVRRLWVYASTQASTDARNRRNQERAALMRQLGGQLGASIAWMQPEIQSLGEEQVEAFIAAEPRLEKHAEGLRDSLRMAKHTLDPAAEAALAAVSPILTASGTTYNLLATVDVDWPTIMVEGEEHRLNQTGYVRLREHPDRAVRQQVFDAFWNKFEQYENTFGSTYSTRVELGVAQARLRNHDSAVAASLAGNNIPESVYRTLVEQTNKGLPTLHRYFQLRQRLLGLDDLHYYDMYPSMIELDKTYPIETAVELTLDASTPLGEDYVAKLAEVSGQRTMHVFPAEGKRSGAYQTSVYGEAPLVFLNHQDNYSSVSTYAHEWGHAMHTLLANENQPYETSSYTIFVAEIAAITNEILLSNLMLERATNDDERLYYLGHALEQMRGTFFRQTMFAEFELAAHDAVQRGEALSGSKLTEMYCDLLKRYHGDEQGVLSIDPVYCQEWAYIPHFYSPFYVYQYSTSIAAAAYFAGQIETGGDEARENYLDILRAGGSEYPYQLLKDAGLDMASPAPYRALLSRMDAIMDEIEAILDA